MASKSLPIQHLRSDQEEADTRILLHALDATQRGATSITIQSPDLGFQDTLSRRYSDCWKRRKMKKYSIRPTLRGGWRRTCEGFNLAFTLFQDVIRQTLSVEKEVSCWNTLKKEERSVLYAFSSLGKALSTDPDDIYTMLEHFVCKLYIPSTQLRTIGEV